MPLLGNHEGISLLDPVPYRELVYLMEKSVLVVTDSGGLQEEAPALGKPVLVLREKTERPEGIEAGIARLVGTDKDNIIRHVTELLLDETERENMMVAKNPYGDGTAAEQIVREVLRFRS
jgi:UDP-N-acetylglucosamine 2-epimerase (non-hydrolysing)